MYKTRARGSWGNIVHLLNFFQSQDIVGAERRAITAVNANLGLVLFSIPKDGSKRTCLDTVLAANTMFSFEGHAPALPL
jgi:hypothetical protein